MAIRLVEAIANIKNFERLDSGSLKVEAIARSPGILTYFDADGPRRELVTSAFLRSKDGSGFPLAGQLGDIPVTLEHPPTLLRNDANKIDQYGVGKTKPKVKVYSDGRIQVEMEISDNEAIQAIESGAKRGVSLGYLCNINRTDGVYQGARYDAEQCAPFSADHLAIVANPRAREALIQSFERTDSDDFRVALYEEFEPVSNVVDSPRSDHMPLDTAATVALSDAIQAPETFQIEIGGKPFRLDAAAYEALQTERLDMKKKMEAMYNDMDDPDDDDDEMNEAMMKKRKDAADQISLVLEHCDADDLSGAIHNLSALISRFDNVETVADVVDAVDEMQGRIDALGHQGDESEGRYDAGDVTKLLEKLDAATPTDALISLEGKEFVATYGNMLPPEFNFDGQSLHELRLEAIKYADPTLELRSDSEGAVLGAFDVVANRFKPVDSTAQLDRALGHNDGVNHALPGTANRMTGTPMNPKQLHPSVFNVSAGVK